MRRPNPASRKVRLINQLKHTKGPAAGELFRLRRWQEHQIIRPLFSVDPATGLRKYRMCLLMLPRKNGKTTLAAALAIDGLLFDGEAGAEIYSAAADREQASLVFNEAAQMIRADAELSAMCEIIDSQKRIVHRASGSFYKAISAEAYSKFGYNCSRLIYDELASAPTRDLWDALTTSTGARAQPLVIAISTAGHDRHSILWELYSHAKKVQADPSIDPTFLPIIFEAPQDADWTDEKVWKSCNPALGDFRSIEEMRIACRRAKEIPAQEMAFRRLYLNQWVESAVRWIAMASWDACRQPIDRASLRGRPCYVGLDLSTTTDLTAAVAIFPGEGGFDVLAHGFVPADRIPLRVTRDRVPYDLWSKQGHLTAIPGPVIDYDRVRALLKAWDEEFSIQVISYDPWNATDLIGRLEREDGFTCVKVRQGVASLTAPSKSFESAILTKRLRHDGDPVLRWTVSNLSVKTDDAGNLMPSKAASSEKIDSAVALILAIDAMDRHPAAPKPRYAAIVMGR